MKKSMICLLLLGLFFTGCYYNKEELLYACPVDAASTKYSTAIAPMLTSYGCRSCHSGTVPSGGIRLETYADVKKVVDNGQLYGAVSHAPGFIPMPQTGGQISDCDLKKIKAWIDAGAPNN